MRYPTVRDRRCVDCAFHPSSPENEPGGGPIAAEGGSIVQYLQMRLQQDGTATLPFFCHDNLPCVTVDGWRRVAAIDTPSEQLEVCAGWAAEYRRVTGQEPGA
jgi:hypothetical protein